MRKVYETGVAIRPIASQVGRSYGFAHRALRDAGTTLRGRGAARGSTPKRRITAEQGAQRAELAQKFKVRYEDNEESVEGIASLTGRSPYIVRRLLHEAGAQMRGAGGRRKKQT